MMCSMIRWEIQVISVIGGTLSAGEAALESARGLGNSIVSERCILLTGGRADRSEKSVKATVMCGAVDAGRPDRPAGAIGILNNSTNDPAVDLRPDAANPSSHLLYLHAGAGVSNHERNVLTGGLADVVIALPGETGTLSEVAYALECGRPLVFLNSWPDLRDTLGRLSGKVAGVIDKLGEKRYVSAAMLENLERLFRGELDSGRYAVLNQADPSEAVKVAVALGQGQRDERYPELEQHSLKGFRRDFESRLEDLEKIVAGYSQ